MKLHATVKRGFSPTFEVFQRHSRFLLLAAGIKPNPDASIRGKERTRRKGRFACIAKMAKTPHIGFCGPRKNCRLILKADLLILICNNCARARKLSIASSLVYTSAHRVIFLSEYPASNDAAFSTTRSDQREYTSLVSLPFALWDFAPVETDGDKAFSK